MEKGFILVLIIAIIVGVFAIANGDRVEIDFIFTKLYMSQAMVIIMSTFLGAMIVFLIDRIKTFKLTQEIKNLRKKINHLEDENKLMKSLDEVKGQEEKEDLVETLEIEEEKTTNEI